MLFAVIALAVVGLLGFATAVMFIVAAVIGRADREHQDLALLQILRSMDRDYEEDPHEPSW